MEQLSTLEYFGILAETVRVARGHIVDVWMRRCRQAIDAARPLETLALQDSVVDLLAAFERTLGTPSEQGEQQAHNQGAHIARIHGETRHAQWTYDMVQVVHEYRLLRGVIFEVLCAKHGALTLQAITAVNEFFDIAISQSAEAFAQRRLNAMAAEKALAQQDQQKATAALHQVQGHVTQLDEVMARKEQFMSFLSHDLRSPLTVIMLTTQSLTRRLAGSTHLKFVARIERAAAKADRMLQGLLDIRRAEVNQRTTMHFGDCDLAAVLHHLEQDLTQRYGERFVCRSPSSLVSHCDAAALERALENLCSNAVKYGDADAPIRVEIEADDEFVVVSVTNGGPPLSETEQKRLFKPFYRSERAECGGAEGWGLGLAYVWQVAQLHGGRASVTSNAQQGTTFYLRFPRDARRVFAALPVATNFNQEGG